MNAAQNLPQTAENSADPTPLSPAYHALKAHMDACEMWETMDAEARLPIILDSFAVEEWFGVEALPTLAIFRHRPAGRWGQIKARFKTIGGNPFDLEKEVGKLLQAAQESITPGTITPTRRHAVTTMSEVDAEPIAWLWWPYLAVGKIAMLDGDPGIGKSLLMTQLAASLSRGYPLPDQQGKLTLPTGSPQPTLLLSTEDGLRDTLKPRLVAADADCRKVHVLTGWFDPKDALHAFTLEHLDVLTDALREYQPRLVVIDPIQAYLGKMDMHRANETRPLLTALAGLAAHHRCAVVCLRHPSKPGQGASGKAIHRGLGSVDFIATARTGLFVEQHPVDPGKVLLSQDKSNIGVYGRTQLFSKYEGQFLWCGVTRLTVEMYAGNKRGPDPMAFVEAFCWLEQRLEGGLAWASADIEEEMLTDGYKKDTIRKAKKALGVVSKQTPTGWTWRLEPLSLIPPPSTVTVPSTLTALTTVTTLSDSLTAHGDSSTTGAADRAVGAEEADTAVTVVVSGKHQTAEAREVFEV